jgi:hypothetical protein
MAGKNKILRALLRIVPSFKECTVVKPQITVVQMSLIIAVDPLAVAASD